MSIDQNGFLIFSSSYFFPDYFKAPKLFFTGLLQSNNTAVKSLRISIFSMVLFVKVRKLARKCFCSLTTRSNQNIDVQRTESTSPGLFCLLSFSTSQMHLYQCNLQYLNHRQEIRSYKTAL